MDFTNLTATLQSLGYRVSSFDTAAQAADYLNRQIDGCTVGVGGSVTLRDMGMYELLSAHNKVNWHWYPEGRTVDEVRMAALTSDVYLSSVNALAETGEIINIDGACNRVAATLFNREQLYLIIGENKITPDYNSAAARARNVAAPLNARRLGKKTPCTVGELKCHNCNSPERICAAMSVTWFKPMSVREAEVIIIRQELGF
jgi:hypothetical protein